jgi:hypothetical protein
MSTIRKIAGTGNADRKCDVVFVHGLDGDATTSWHPRNAPDKFWPAWLGADLPQVGVWSVDFDVAASAWKGTTMPLSDRAINVLDLLDLEGIGERPIVFVCHSLGGLLVKQMLRHGLDFGNDGYRKIATSTRGIVFLSTPHSGADIATWMTHLANVLPLRISVSVDELKSHDPRLRELNTWYRNTGTGSITNLVYCEKLSLNGILVVNETTADPGIKGVVPVPMDADHVTICKPDSRDHQIYRRVKKLVEETAARP